MNGRVLLCVQFGAASRSAPALDRGDGGVCRVADAGRLVEVGRGAVMLLAALIGDDDHNLAVERDRVVAEFRAPALAMQVADRFAKMRLTAWPVWSSRSLIGVAITDLLRSCVSKPRSPYVSSHTLSNFRSGAQSMTESGAFPLVSF